MLCVTPRSIALPLLLALSACPADPTPVDTTDGTTSTDPSTTNDPTTNPSSTTTPSTTDDPSTTTVDPSDPTTTTVDPSDPTSTTTDADSSSTDASSETTHASHATESSSSTDAQESSSSTDAQEESSSSDGGLPPDCNAGDGPLFTVVNNGFASYTINGQENPSLTVVRGCDYTFDIAAAGHPFYLKTVQGTGVGNAYNTGVVGNGTSNGDLTWSVANNAPDDLFYNCQFHAAMSGTITVID
jgi:hypothetical protein